MDKMLGKTYYGKYSELPVDPLYRLRPPSHPHNDHIATFLPSMLDTLMLSKANSPDAAPLKKDNNGYTILAKPRPCCFATNSEMDKALQTGTL